MSTPTTPDNTDNPGDGSEIFIPCIESSMVRGYTFSPLPYRDSITVFRPPVNFNITMYDYADEVKIIFEEVLEDMVMLYYPGFYDPFDKNFEDDSIVNCILIDESPTIIRNLITNMVYTFCSLHKTPIFTPFQCKSHVTAEGMPWLYKEQKAVIITSLTLLFFLSLITGILMTYFLIRRIPTLIKGSKRVVIVNNRTKEVMILPRSNNDSINNSCRKESATPIHPMTPEPPTYLTPLPRQSIDQR